MGWQKKFLSEAGREAKYFPDGDFMNAKKGKRASWLWSSIIEGRKVLNGNVCKSIGNGRGTRIWGDHWLADIPGCPGLYSLVNMEEQKQVLISECRH
ncbi:uncharacterized protein LOC114724543 [Neltuma alba]|nr:uncharacterized protein LOC114724543 [Prosopis alba]